MTDLTLTEYEKEAFCQEINKGLALDYFCNFDNVPLHFIYQDKAILGELTDLERRNKALTETLWLDAYNLYSVCNVAYAFLYRGMVLQLPLQAYIRGAGGFTMPLADSNRVYTTLESVLANFDTWMESAGWRYVEKYRNRNPRGEWEILLGAPDRTMRLGSIMPVGNQVLGDIIITWTEDGVLKETAFGVVLLYDVDGTVLLDRSYCDLVNWPSSPGKSEQEESGSLKNRPQDGSVLDEFYNYQKDRQVPVENSDLEKRNLSIIEGDWVDAYNTDLNVRVFHPERFRMQLPHQKCSYNMKILKEVEEVIKEAAPDRKMRIVMTYAKGNQVVVEGIISWNEKGIYIETPFMSFILLDKDGLIIRDRRYLTLNNWPGAEKVIERLDL